MQQTLSRRGFLIQAGGALAVAATRVSGAEGKAGMKAAVIGHTGRGDYGHSLDVILNDLRGVEVVAVADPTAAGRAKAKRATGALRDYADWRELLEKEQPELVCLASRWSEHRHEIGMAALRQGAHLITEKPFTRTLQEADDLLALAGEKSLKIAVAHQMRLAESVQNLKKALDAGLIGDLVQIHSWGKQDSRAGGEDMMVLGTHLFDMIRFLAGDAEWCSARVLENGRDITRESGRSVREQIGTVAGTQIFAQFGFPTGLNVTFTSDRRLRETLGPWGMELVGSKGRVRILTEIYSSVYILRPGKFQVDAREDRWERWEGDPGGTLTAEERGFIPANRRVALDFLEAIQEDREPKCSGYGAMKAIEMVMAVYWAALGKKRVELPLENREHPFRS